MPNDSDDQEFASLLDKVLLEDERDDEAAELAEMTAFVRGVLYASGSTSEAIECANAALVEIYGVTTALKHNVMHAVFGDAYETVD